MNEIALKEQDLGYIFDKENPHSIINMCNSVISERIALVPASFIDMGTEALENDIEPTKTDKAIKKVFWMIYNQAILNNEKFTGKDIYGNICSPKHFHKEIIGNSKKLAWLLIPPVSQELEFGILNDKVMERLNDIVDMDITNSKGQVDAKKADIVLRAARVILDRTSPTVQRIESKNLSVKITGKEENIDKRIEEVRNKLSR